MLEKRWNVQDYGALAAEHERLQEIYAKAVDVLFTTGYKVSDAEYAELKAAIQEVRLRAETCRLRLQMSQGTGLRAN